MEPRCLASTALSSCFQHFVHTIIGTSDDDLSRSVNVADKRANPERATRT